MFNPPMICFEKIAYMIIIGMIEIIIKSMYSLSISPDEPELRR